AAFQDSLQTFQASAGQCPRFRLFAGSVRHVTKGRYITSDDPRGYMCVYFFALPPAVQSTNIRLNNQWIMMDIDDGYILWTGIWKVLGNSKADIVKMIDSQPDLAHVMRRVRGGFLKIQGTWMPFEIALRLARRSAFRIIEFPVMLTIIFS
ncbi:transcription regulator HTH, apses-type DNA-binding domain-containing protein, partial [Mycena galericulata]